MRKLIILPQRHERLDGEYTISIGWDAEYQTFYANVVGPVGPGSDEEDAEILLWEGNSWQEYPRPDALIELLRPYAVIPVNLVDLLYGPDVPIDWERLGYGPPLNPALLEAGLLDAMQQGVPFKGGVC